MLLRQGLLHQVKTFHFIICLSTFNLLSITNALLKTLQDPKSSKSFLDYSSLRPIIDHYKLSNDDIKVELIHAKEVLQNKPLDSISDVIDQLMPLHVAFPNLKQVQIALTLSAVLPVREPFRRRRELKHTFYNV